LSVESAVPLAALAARWVPDVAVELDGGPGWGEDRRKGERRAMARKYVDCREVPSEMNCTVGIAADSEEEVLEAAVQHAVAVHSHEDTPELRSMIRQSIKETEAASV
jgi:predicted small metal-binding protein